MISGVAVRRRTKLALAQDVAVQLGFESVPQQSRGSSVDSEFLRRVLKRLDPSGPSPKDAYRVTEAVLNNLGLTYDPFWDTSEAAEAGGSTVTARAFSRIWSAVTGTPRCFVLMVNDAPVGSRWETNHEEIYRYDSTVSGRMAFNDAGPGSKILYYSTSKSRTNQMSFVATATVDYIYPGWEGPWEAVLSEYESLATPVPSSKVEINGWNRQNAITEINLSTFSSIVEAGNGKQVQASALRSSSQAGLHKDAAGEARVARRIIEEFSASSVAPQIELPEATQPIDLIFPPPRLQVYVASEDGLKETIQRTWHGPSRNRSRDRDAEKRAIDLVTQAMLNEGWFLRRDCQQDGIGYDLEFAKQDRVIKAEVKGIQGANLAFNLTPKECWMAEKDSDWLLIAVTNVLSPTDFRIRCVSRAEVIAGDRVPTGYRVTL